VEEKPKPKPKPARKPKRKAGSDDEEDSGYEGKRLEVKKAVEKCNKDDKKENISPKIGPQERLREMEKVFERGFNVSSRYLAAADSIAMAEDANGGTAPKRG